MTNQAEEALSGDKHYFTIGEVAKMFNLNASTVRYWENEFEVLRPKKNKKGDRLFTRRDIDHLQTITFLIREKGYTVEGAKRQLQQNLKGELDKAKLIYSLKEVRGFLIELRARLGE